MGNFGPRLKELREAAGLSQKQLAEKAGLSQSAIGHWEQELRKPNWDNVQSLCAALGVDCRAFAVVAKPAAPRKVGRPKKSPADKTADKTTRRPPRPG